MKTPLFHPHGLRFTPWHFQKAIVRMADRRGITPSQVYAEFLEFIRSIP